MSGSLRGRGGGRGPPGLGRRSLVGARAGRGAPDRTGTEVAALPTVYSSPPPTHLPRVREVVRRGLGVWLCPRARHGAWCRGRGPAGVGRSRGGLPPGSGGVLLNDHRLVRPTLALQPGSVFLRPEQPRLRVSQNCKGPPLCLGASWYP